MTPERELDGRVAIVTGAGRGIRLGIAKVLASEGAHVVIAEFAEERGAEADAAGRSVSLAQGLGRAGAHVIVHGWDPA